MTKSLIAKVVAGEPCALKGARTVRRVKFGDAPLSGTTIVYSTWLVEGSNPSGPIYIQEATHVASWI